MTVPRFTIAIDETPAPADQDVVQRGLRDFNIAVIGPSGERPISCFVRDDAGQVVGGLLGHVKWRWLYVAKLWLPEGVRGHGVGSRVMAAIEDYAWAHDCLGVYLDTFEYQALPFYRKLGYELYGTLDGYPPGYRQYYLRKVRPTGTISG
ncbi:MAG: GNAT family N-acetyltransferase [Gemmatimonadota bacterium]|nr:GNAT family N-acetyltransferase [Gemmatimonadota bacterium]